MRIEDESDVIGSQVHDWEDIDVGTELTQQLQVSP